MAKSSSDLSFAESGALYVGGELVGFKEIVVPAGRGKRTKFDPAKLGAQEFLVDPTKRGKNVPLGKTSRRPDGGETIVIRIKVGAKKADRTYVISDLKPRDSKRPSKIQRAALEKVLEGKNKTQASVAVKEIADALWDSDPQAALDLRIELDERLAAVVTVPAPADEGLAALWGPEPSVEEVKAATRDGARERRSALQDLKKRAWTREQAAEHLHITPQSVSSRIDKHDLLGLKIGRTWWLPDWQFTDDGSVDGMRQLFAAWPSSVVALDVWAREPHPDLKPTPAGVLRRSGGIDRVLDVLGVEADSRW